MTARKSPKSSELRAETSGKRKSSGRKSDAVPPDLTVPDSFAADSLNNDHAVLKIVALLEAGLLEPGTFSGLVIRHEENCPRIQRGGACRCNPEIEIVPPKNSVPMLTSLLQ